MSASDGAIPPKIFVSYSWSNEDHQSWVLRLAERMVSDGVDVILDKWDLRVGHDANVFMEQMVTDPAVAKVILVCDRVYVEKADGRRGGVGKEAQILTREIYEKADQNKYAAVITERDEHGKAYIPAYYGGRQFIDFTDEDKAEASYEELLRWIYDRPYYVKPKIGKAPTFISEPETVITGTSSRFKRAEQAIRSGSPTARGLVVEFGDALIQEFIERAPVKTDKPFDEEVERAADTMRPALRNLNELVLTIARFSGTGFDAILQILERLADLTHPTEQVTAWNEEQFDPYRMMCYEGFVAMTAILIGERRFDLLEMAVDYSYYVADPFRTLDTSQMNFRVFWQGLPSFENRKRRLQSRERDMYATLINEIYSASFPSMESLVQADIVLYLCGIFKFAGRMMIWWPRTLIYARRHKALRLFAQSTSLQFFNSWAPKVIGPVSPDDFRSTLAKHASDFQNSYFFTASIKDLTNSDLIGTQP